MVIVSMPTVPSIHAALPFGIHASPSAGALAPFKAPAPTPASTSMGAGDALQRIA